MGKINLLYCVTKLELGGAQKHVLTLIRNADKERYNVFLFAAAEGLLVEEARSIPGLNVIRSGFLERSINPLKDILAFFEIARVLTQHHISVIHTHSSKAGILGRFAARAVGVQCVIHTVHGWPFHERQSFFLKNCFIFLEKIAARFTDRIVVVSSADKARGLARGIGSARQYVLIRPGFEREEFVSERRLPDAVAGIEERDVVVGMIACFKPQKSPGDFIRLAATLMKRFPSGGPSLKFLLVGDGGLRGSLERLIRKYGLDTSVVLTGWRNDIPRILRMMDIVVLTSLWEGLPVSVLETMAAGKPVVVTDTGGISEIIRDHENGFLVAPGRVEAMSQKVAMLLENASLREQIGKNAQKTIGEEFSVLTMMRTLNSIYQEVQSPDKTLYVAQ